MGIIDDLKKTFKNGSILVKLIYINVAVFIILTIAAVIGFLLNDTVISEKAIGFLAIPSSLGTLVRRPWTILTYMFVHKDIWHILFNMIWLYWFGLIFLEYLDQRKLLAVYLLGGITGAFVYVLSFNIFPAFAGVVSESVAIGASASVMAIVVAIAAYVPDYTVQLFILGKIRIKYLALTIFVLTSIMDFSINSGGKLAHIGGAFMGYIYTINLRRGIDPGKKLNKISDWFVTIFKPRKKLKVTYKKVVNEYEYNKIKAEHQMFINKILDKISKGGYDSLTKEEKEILFKESQKKNY
jgi:membrane associated rhomboid family serine protease